MGVAYWYCRESHADSYANQNSKQTQEGICQSYYEFRVKPLGIHVGKIFYDPKTSARHVPFLQRQAGRELNNILRAGDHVIFSHLDRGYRAVLDFSQVMEDWKQRGITVHFASLGVDLSTPAGMLVANLMCSVSQGESDLKSERNREIAAFQRRANRPTNGERKFGYRVAGPKGDRQFVPFTAERDVMAQIVQLHDRGFTWKEVSTIIETWSPKITFKAIRLFSSFTLYDHFPKGYWAWWRCRLAYYTYKKIVEREAKVLARANHADAPAPSA